MARVEVITGPERRSAEQKRAIVAESEPCLPSLGDGLTPTWRDRRGNAAGLCGLLRGSAFHPLLPISARYGMDRRRPIVLKNSLTQLLSAIFASGWPARQFFIALLDSSTNRSFAAYRLRDFFNNIDFPDIRPGVEIKPPATPGFPNGPLCDFRNSYGLAAPAPGGAPAAQSQIRRPYGKFMPNPVRKTAAHT